MQLGGGRQRPGDAIDPRVGLSGLMPLGGRPARGTPLAWVHAATEAQAEDAIRAVQAAYHLAGPAEPAQAAGPSVLQTVLPSPADTARFGAIFP